MGAKIATTQWSQVLAARDGAGTEARRALEALCQTYWHPLYAFIRQQGSDAEQAKDLTQAYFTELLAKDFLSAVDPSKGRFRSFLLASLRNFLSSERNRSRRLKRGGGTITLSLDAEEGEQRYVVHPVDDMTPQDVFEHRWAVTVLDRAMSRLERESRTSDDEARFQELRVYLTGEGARPYRETAARLGLSEGALKVKVHRLRKRFGHHLRAEIAETVHESSSVEAEARYLLRLLRR